VACGLVVVAFAVRLAWGLAAGVTPGGVGFDDAAWYHHTATALARGEGYVSPFTGLPTAAWPPGYPLVLALGYRLAGATPATAVVMNAAFGALTCLFVWRLGTRLGGPRTGLVATALLAGFPGQIFFGALVLSETLFTCLTIGLLLAATQLFERGDDAGFRAWMLWGLVAGGVALVRAEAVALALVPAASLASLGVWHRGTRVLAATVLGALCALTPWTIRNASVFGTLVPTSTGLGRTLWIGHNPEATGGMSDVIQHAMDRKVSATGLDATGPAGELAVNRLLLRDALAFAATHPGRELFLAPARTYHLFRGDHVWQAWYDRGTPRFLPTDTARRFLGGAGNVYYLVVGVLALAGWIVRPQQTAAGWRALGTLGFVWIAIFTAIYGDPRFHHVLVPPACILAAVTIVRLTGARRQPELDVAPAR
jgi:4-amino-4-deoxy-L-arabinose transferase-like glycosyltransferase